MILRQNSRKYGNQIQTQDPQIGCVFFPESMHEFERAARAGSVESDPAANWKVAPASPNFCQFTDSCMTPPQNADNCTNRRVETK